jgi:hypothetical protein
LLLITPPQTIYELKKLRIEEFERAAVYVKREGLSNPRFVASGAARRTSSLSL